MIITLCGSSRFKPLFRKIEKQLALEGNLVLSLSIFAHYDNIELSDNEKFLLDKIHKQKIELADKIFVINLNNYTGYSTKNEIHYAESLGKVIEYLE